VTANGASSSSQTYPLPKGPSPVTGRPFWTGSALKYEYRDARGENGPVRSAQIKRTSGGTFVIKAVVDGKLGDVDVTVVPPDPGSDGCLLLGLNGGDTYSVQFGPGSRITNVDSTLFKARRPTAEGSCVVAVPVTVPTQPSIVVPGGRQLLLQRRKPDGTLECAVPYVIRGVTWSPASSTTNTTPTDPNNAAARRPEFGAWYQTDIPLLKAMNVNTVRTFLDFGLPGDVTVDGLDVLDEFYRNGIMVVMTVDDAINNTARAKEVVTRYKNHPAVLGWSLGNEWNINRYYGVASSVADAAQRTQAAAALLEAEDVNHPIISSYGEIDIDGDGRRLSDTSNYVNNVCPSVDVWSLNIYRGDHFGAPCRQTTLFEQWESISDKPMFLGEFGIDAFRTTVLNPPAGVVDEAQQAQWDTSLWQDLRRHLSADDPSLQALGGTVFEWNDEWWKVPPPAAQQPDGWLSGAFPDGMGNEEYFGLVTIGRSPRQAYDALTSLFDPTAPRGPWELSYRALSVGTNAAGGAGCGFARLLRGSIPFFCGAGCSLTIPGRGFNVAEVDPVTGQVLRQETYDTYSNDDEKNEMVADLDGLPDRRMLMIAVGDEAGLTHYSNPCEPLPSASVTNLIQALEALGSTKINSTKTNEYCYRDSWAMIAVKGEGTARSEQHSHDKEAVAEIALQIP
jgi:hypothetical protein